MFRIFVDSCGKFWSLGGQGTFCKPCIASSWCPTSSPWPTKVGTPIASKRYFILASWYKWLHHHKTIWRWGDYVKSPTLKLAWRRLLIYTVYIRIKRRARTWGGGKSQFHLPSWFFSRSLHAMIRKSPHAVMNFRILNDSAILESPSISFMVGLNMSFRVGILWNVLAL